MTISDTLLPEIITSFRDAHPDIRVRVHEDSSPQALEKVLNGQSEFALAQFGEGHPDLEFEPLINDRFVITCLKKHRLAKLRSTTWEEIIDEDFILLRTGSGTSKLLRRTLGPLYDLISKDMETGHFHSQLGMVGRGIGIAAIPTLIQLSRKDLDLATIQISKPTVSRQLGIVTYRGRSLSPAAKKLREIAVSIMSGFDN